MSTPAYIDRLLVEEGFLDGLDLTFQPGLNVIVGSRGVGKTSVVQLLRFCLGVPAFSPEFDDAATRHAREILGEDGRVSARLIVDGEEFVVSRRRRDDVPEGDLDPVPKPIVLAQTEIEEIGTDPTGRLRLVDDFRSAPTRLAARERATASALQSLAVELHDLDAEIELQEDALRHLEATEKQVSETAKEVSAAEETASAAKEDFRRLDALGKEAAEAQARAAVLERALKSTTDWRSSLERAVRAAPSTEPWPSDGPSPLEQAEAEVERAVTHLRDAIDGLATVTDGLTQSLAAERKSVTAVEDEARGVRRRVEKLQSGAGAATRRLASLRERVAQLQGLAKVLSERKERRANVQQARAEALKELEGIRSQRSAERQIVADNLNAALGPRIEVRIRQSGSWSAYAETIAGMLQGSKLHYSDLAPQIAQSLTPQELMGVVESGDPDRLAEAVGIPTDRAQRVIGRIRESGMVELVAAQIDDAVEMALLDGADYKLTDDLSTGQRCTTILPILLQHEERPVIIDQPEDHLDGAFIVDTLVRSILHRGTSQLITSTHNANIPVLGDASQVTLLGSDGHRGFEIVTGDLRKPEIVSGITSIMEGGKEAFDRRAQFYGSV